MRVALLLAAGVILGAGSKKTPPPKPQADAGFALGTDEEKALYALGADLAGRVSVFDLSPQEIAIVERGFDDAAKDPTRLAVDVDAYRTRVQSLARSRIEAHARSERAKQAQLAASLPTDPHAQKFPSGLVLVSLSPGNGDSPHANDTVLAQYRGTLMDGTEFDSSYRHGRPMTFELNHVISCWTEAIQHMKPGGHALLLCPPSIAYGAEGAPPQIPANATLMFDLELLEVQKK